MEPEIREGEGLRKVREVPAFQTGKGLPYWAKPVGRLCWAPPLVRGGADWC